MIQYIIEAIAFQLVFLIIYDLFLKRETFFQWNRLYLIGTYALSLVLPWVKIEALKTTVSQEYDVYPMFLWNLDEVTVTPSTTEGFLSSLPWGQVLLFGGMVAAALLFAFKLYKIQQLRNKGQVRHFPNFTRIVIQNSNLAFSFFKSIFMGDKVLEKEHESIIRHELVHIEQKHSWDLIFFELMRIGSWFNPLVYVYQSRISELHEFIADAAVAKTDKKESYQLLLSEVFQTEHISFINQFFKSSLIKKRIVMLQKSRSKSIWRLKYLALVPLLVGMLFYTSCERELDQMNGEGEVLSVGDIENLTEEEETKAFGRILELSNQPQDWNFSIKDENTTILFSKPINENSGISGPNGIPIKAMMRIESKVLTDDFNIFNHTLSNRIDINVDVPFAVIEEVPIFPGCEDAIDKRACFNEKIQRHISKNFRYPEEAQEMGVQGRVSVLFVIQEDGSIGGVRMRGSDKLLEDEAARIIAKLPQMAPGKQKGKNVQVPFSIPITFKLEQANFNPAAKTQKNDSEFDTKRLQMDEFMAEMDAVPFAKLDEAPVFPGCEGALKKEDCFRQNMQQHISKNFRYPEDAQKRGIQGRVAILFTISEDGLVNNIKYRGPDPSLEAEAERIIRKLPRMTAGKRNGNSVSAVYAIPITFKLQ